MSVYGVGYDSGGKHPRTVGGRGTVPYKAWAAMLARCYRETERLRSYRDCTVHAAWLNFQNFADWFEAVPNSRTPGFVLDKDLRIAGSRMYSPESCSFVPTCINTVIQQRRKANRLAVGVRTNNDKYQAQISVHGKRHGLGTFDTVAEASLAYQVAKKEHLQRMAEQYREVLHPEVYATLMNWEVEKLK